MIYRAIFLLGSLIVHCVHGMEDKKSRCANYICQAAQNFTRVIFTGRKPSPPSQAYDKHTVQTVEDEKNDFSLTNEQVARIKEVEEQFRKEKAAEDRKNKTKQCTAELTTLMAHLCRSYKVVKEYKKNHPVDESNCLTTKEVFSVAENILEQLEANRPIAEKEIRDNQAIYDSSEVSRAVKSRLKRATLFQVYDILSERPSGERVITLEDKVITLDLAAKSADEKIKALQTISRDRQRLKDFRDRCGKSLGL